MSERRAAGRLAFREEGTWFKAYYAEPDTMKGALLLGTIRMQFITARLECRHEFIALMQASAASMIEEVFGSRPSFPEGPEPPRERQRKSG